MIPIAVAQPVVIENGVTRYTAPNAGVMTGPGTNVYWIGEARVTLIDPGPDDPTHIDALLDEVGDRLERVVVTHTHRDHSPAATPIAKATGVPLFGMQAPNTIENDQTFVPDVEFADGDVLDCDGHRLTVLHTPGHASNHACFLLAGPEMLFTGDHIMEGSTVVIAAPDGDMQAYFDSMARLRTVGARCIAPGHGRVIADPVAAIDAIVEHRKRREALVLDMVAQHAPVSTDDLLPKVYSDVPEVVLPVARMSLLAHLTKLADDGQISGDDACWDSMEQDR